MTNIFKSYSSRETAEFGFALAEQLSRGGSPSDRSIGKPSAQKDKSSTRKHEALKVIEPASALVVALSGDLGAGKTTFTQGFAKGLGVKRRIASPTFVLLRRFPIRRAPFTNFYHIDAYRIKKTDALEAIGIGEIVANPRNVVLIEWPEKIKKSLPQKTVWLKFRHGKKENERAIFHKFLTKS